MKKKIPLKNKREDFNETYKDPLLKWCPLFGTLPSCESRDGISEKCLRNIEDARCMMGGFEYLSGLDSPEPERIEKNTGYPAAWIIGARFLVHVFSAHEILSDAQFRQGLYRNGRGWVDGRNESYYFIDVDQLDPVMLNDSIKHRAGLTHEFKISLIADPKKLPKEWNHPIITPAMTFALMSISVSWYLFKNIADGTVQPKSYCAVERLLTAEKLLKRANELMAEFEKEILEDENKELQDSLEETERKTPRTPKKQSLYALQKWKKEKPILVDRNDKLIEAVRTILKGKKRKMSNQEIYNALSSNEKTKKLLTIKGRQLYSIIGPVLKEHNAKHMEEIDT